MESIILGGGCFWCLDASFRLVKGVDNVVSGYAGGNYADPNYFEVSSGKTGHAEVVKIDFDPTLIKLDKILEIFFTIHDPTTLNRQGADIGTQYRSVIYYSTDSQKSIIDDVIHNIQNIWKDPVVTEVKKLTKFYPAEEYHQEYFKNNSQTNYCQLVVNPKLQKLKKEFSSYLK